MTVVWLGLHVGLLAVGVEPVPNALAGLQEPIPHNGLPCPALTEGEELSSTSTLYVVLC